VKDYRIQTRGGKGLKTMNITEKGGPIISSHIVCGEDRAIFITKNGIALRLRLNEIRCCGRSTQGVRLINLMEGDRVASVAIVTKPEEEDDEEKQTVAADSAPDAAPVLTSENG